MNEIREKFNSYVNNEAPKQLEKMFDGLNENDGIMLQSCFEEFAELVLKQIPERGQVNAIVNCKYPRRTQDDFVFIYRDNDGNRKVFGISDANYYHEKLLNDGYKHTATLSASMWIERLMQSSHYDRGDMIDRIDS